MKKRKQLIIFIAAIIAIGGLAIGVQVVNGILTDPYRDTATEYEESLDFEDGKIVCYDVKPQLEKEVFINSCTILNDTLAWDIAGNRDTTKCIDIAPDMLYELERVTEKIA